MPPYTAVVLTGGRSTRFGRDKTAAIVGGGTVLQRVLDGCADATAVVVAGPRVGVSATARLTWVREQPVGGGPLAGLASALPHVATPTVVVLAGDLPFSGALVPALLSRLAMSTADAVVPVDATGRRQPLAAVYRTARLRDALAALEPVTGRALRDLLATLVVDEMSDVQLPPRTLLDIDTQAELRLARSIVRDHPEKETRMLQQWTQALTAELGIELDVDTDLVLELARDAAHAVSRPAAPLTTFLVGFAAAQQGGGEAAIAQAADVARLLAARWTPPEQA
jgi:molybdopterin-guanine dinucleotide biosynthesis protein A